MEKKDPLSLPFPLFLCTSFISYFLNFCNLCGIVQGLEMQIYLNQVQFVQTSYNRTLDYKVTMQIHMLIFQNSRGTSPGSLNYLSWPSNGCSTTLQFRVSKASPSRSTMAETSEHDIGLEATLAGWPISLLACIVLGPNHHPNMSSITVHSSGVIHVVLPVRSSSLRWPPCIVAGVLWGTTAPIA